MEVVEPIHRMTLFHNDSLLEDSFVDICNRFKDRFEKRESDVHGCAMGWASEYCANKPLPIGLLKGFRANGNPTMNSVPRIRRRGRRTVIMLVCSSYNALLLQYTTAIATTHSEQRRAQYCTSTHKECECYVAKIVEGVRKRETGRGREGTRRKWHESFDKNLVSRPVSACSHDALVTVKLPPSSFRGSQYVSYQNVGSHPLHPIACGFWM